MSDKSCYVTIINNTQVSMGLASSSATHGKYVSNPASSIPPGQSTTFQLTISGAYGPSGECSYSVGKLPAVFGSVKFSYTCGNSGPNDANVSWISKVDGVEIVMIPNPLPEYDSPMRVQFIVELDK